MIPRSFWWSVFVLSLLDFAVVTWVFFFDRDAWHPDAVVFDVLVLVLTSHRLAYPPKPSRDRA